MMTLVSETEGYDQWTRASLRGRLERLVGRLVVGLRMHGETTEGPVPHKPSPSHQNRRMVSGQGAGTRHGDVQPQAVVEFAGISHISFGIDALVLKATENMTTRSSDRRSEEAGTRAMPRNVLSGSRTARSESFPHWRIEEFPKSGTGEGQGGGGGRRTRTEGDTDARTASELIGPAGLRIITSPQHPHQNELNR